MKKFLNSLAVVATLAALFIFSNPKDATAQNQWGGLCCDYVYTTCHHPIGTNFPDARWEKGREGCPDPIIE